jgi:hypothetical protein
MLRSIINLCPFRKRPSLYPWLVPESLPSMERIVRYVDVPDWSLQPRAVTEEIRLEFDALKFREIDRSALDPHIVTYIPLIECSQFTLSIFFLPPGKSLPFHDHPGQTVFQKLIFGEMRVDMCDEPMTSITTVTAPKSSTTVVTPTENNIHRITATELGALFVDLVVPPYDNDKRSITYFEPDSEGGLRAVRNVDLPMKWLSPNRLFR